MSNNIVYNQNKSGLYFWEYDIEPTIWVSILISSYNTQKEYLEECIKSIKEQIGNFGIELVWINDCSNTENTIELLDLLEKIFNSLNHFKLIYQKTKINRGISFCLHQGLLLCSNELIVRMDSDDIMLNTRIQKQIDFMNSEPSCVICGTNVIIFKQDNDRKIELERSNHRTKLTWDEYKQNPTTWFLNHPTLCYKKSSVLNVGNYRLNFRYPFEDLDMELRVFKKYGIVYNLDECLLLYRRHNGQTTMNIKNNENNDKLKQILINKIINS